MIYFAIPFVVLIVVAIKAHLWNHQPILFAAQQRERAQASELAQALLRNFDALDTGNTGLLTHKHLLSVSELSCNESEQTLLRKALCRAQPEVFVAENPWYLAPLQSYNFTAIGHVIGKRKESRVAATGGMHGAVAYHYEVDVDDYGISKADIESYVSRVGARKTLSAV